MSSPSSLWLFFNRIIGALAIDVTPLKASRDYRLLYTGQFVSTFGTAISYVVLPLQVYQLTHSSFAVGMLGVAEFVPMLSLALVGGALADAVNRQKLLIVTEIGLAAGCGVLVYNALLPQPHLWVLYVAAAFFASLSALHRPAHEALTPRVVAPEHLPAVSVLNTLKYNFGHIAGPALAGIIAASFGPAIAFAIDGATYLVSLTTVMLMRAVPAPTDADRPSLGSIVEGIKYARSRQELLGTYLIDINAMFFGMPFALFPAIAQQFGNASVGLFYAAPSVGALLAGLTSGWTERIHRHGLAVTIAASVWGLAIVGFGLSNSLWLALLFLGLAGAADNISGIFRMTIWNQTIPDYLRGRMAGIEMVSYLSGPYLGNAEAGLVASLFSLRTSVVSGGVLCVAGSAVLAVLLPKFISYDGRTGVAHKLEAETARNNAITAKLQAQEE